MATSKISRAPDATTVREIVREAYDTREKGGARAAGREPGRRVAIVTLYNGPIAPYAVWSNACVRLYAAEHGYALITVEHLLSSRAPQWDKVKAISTLLDDEEAAAAYDYFMWIDADAAFTRLRQPLLETVIDPYMNKDGNKRDFLICDDSPQSPGGEGSTPKGLIRCNTGTFVIRSCPWAREFTRKWWETPMGLEHTPLHEQAVLDKLYAKGLYELQKRLILAPARVLNSAFGELPQRHQSTFNYSTTFVVHMMARNNFDRRNVFRDLFKHLTKESTLPVNSVAMPTRFEHFADTEILDPAKSSTTFVPLLLIITVVVLFLLFLISTFFSPRSKFRWSNSSDARGSKLLSSF